MDAQLSIRFLFAKGYGEGRISETAGSSKAERTTGNVEGYGIARVGGSKHVGRVGELAVDIAWNRYKIDELENDVIIQVSIEG